MVDLPSGKRLHNYGKIHHLSLVNQRTKWQFPIATLPEGSPYDSHH